MGSAVLLAALHLAGCGTAPRPVMGPITVTDVKGNPLTSITSLQRGTAAYFDVTVSQDVELLGADWTVTCSDALPVGSLPAGMVDTTCGTFSPYHTMSGPVPTYPGVTGIVTHFTAPASVPKAGSVTLVVHSTSEPSVTSTLTLNIT